MSDTPPTPAPDAPAPTSPAPPVPLNPTPVVPRHPIGGKVFLAVAAALFFGWLGWLAVTALTKSREPVVSHAQAAAAAVPVRAKLELADPDRESLLLRHTPTGPVATPLKGRADRPAFVVEVVEQLRPNGPAAGTKIGVTNLPACAGYTGPGEYLLLLNPDGDATLDGRPAYTLVGQQRSPGAEPDGAPPMIYKWGDDVGKQVQRLYR